MISSLDQRVRRATLNHATFKQCSENRSRACTTIIITWFLRQVTSMTSGWEGFREVEERFRKVWEGLERLGEVAKGFKG